MVNTPPTLHSTLGTTEFQHVSAPCKIPSFYSRNVVCNNFCGEHGEHTTNIAHNKVSAFLDPLYYSIILLLECCAQHFLGWAHVEHTTKIACNAGATKLNTPPILHTSLGTTKLQHVSTLVLLHHSTLGMLRATVSWVDTR